MRVTDGDDASCLNLNKITNPRILGVDPLKLKGRFTFETSTEELDEKDPWSTLNLPIDNGLIPAIADETVIKWGLGLNVGDTLFYQDARGNELKLLLVGGLAPSIFQGNVIISEEQFLKHFPSHSGTGAFLVEGEISDTALIQSELQMAMRDLGWSMDLSAARLAEFNSVTNTYLSIFMVLGALGLFLGTIGMAILLFRSVLERKHELALLRALGFGFSRIQQIVIREYLFLLIAGTILGALSSILATLPSFLSSHVEASLSLVLIIIFILLINGIFWIWLLSGIALKGKSIIDTLRNE
jgi:multisubunit Na+/H+ antiporter MnhG subunit